MPKLTIERVWMSPPAARHCWFDVTSYVGGAIVSQGDLIRVRLDGVIVCEVCVTKPGYVKQALLDDPSSCPLMVMYG